MCCRLDAVVGDLLLLLQILWWMIVRVAGITLWISLNFVAEEDGETVETAGTQTVAVSQTEEDVVKAKPMEVEGNGTLDIEELAEKPKSEQGDGAEVVNNVVLRKFLRGPKYFNPPEANFNSTCYNCGEEGHMGANCQMEKRKKPCLLCVSVEHGAKKCKQTRRS